MLRSWAGRLRELTLRALWAPTVLGWYTAAALAHDTGGLHIHPPDLSGVRSPTGTFLAGVVAVLMFGFFGGCAVMLLLDLIRERRERRERARRERAQGVSTESPPEDGRRTRGEQ